MPSKPTGGPAFPPSMDPRYNPSGMSMRDWFAGQAIPEAMADYDLKSAEAIATHCYHIADAMLIARSKP